nr:P-loop NTPase fold protein [uncultured Flavobacterium sp.]
MGRFLRDFFQNNIAVPAVIIFIFLYFQKAINLFIETFLMSDPFYNTGFLQLIIALAFLGSTSLLAKKLIIDKYLPARAEYLFISLFSLLIIYYRFNFNGLNWNLHLAVSTRYISIKYLDMLLLLLFFYFSFNIVGTILKRLNNPASINNFLISDDPILTKEQDLLNYDSTVGRLTEILINDKHPKSISIGLIGPWGNGKSSVIQLVKNNIEASEQFNKKEIISIHFLPYLNHNENEIINEFFTLLSNELTPYNGRLSNQIVDYSEKLTDLYQNKNLKGFLENHITNFSQSSACELYENINKMLEETGKKIIVFIDDLDRLNQKEILQTLKLIRNTANFTNTFFVLAMDKQYVIKRLSAKGNILDTKFVDKFFQLEIYLPEIDNGILKQYFITELLRPFSPAPDNLDQRLHSALADPSLLFEDYVKNFRDVKRIVNQIKYDLTLFKEDFSYLNLKDFINFTFFKLKFPHIMKELNDNRGKYLTIDRSKGIYNLQKVKKDHAEEVKNLMIFMDNESIDSILYLDKYQLYNEILNNSADNDANNEKITRTDKELLVKSLANLFGEENAIQGQDSIKYINNFQMLIQQRIFSNFFKQSEFEALFTADKNDLKSELNKIKEQGKEEQFIGRLRYFSTNDQPKLQRLVEYLMLIYEFNGLENHYDLDTYKLIEKFTCEMYDVLGEERILEYQKWADETIFSNSSVSEQTKLILLGTIWKVKHFNDHWHLKENFIIEKTADLYEKYLSNFDQVLWDVNNYRSFNAYHESKVVDHDRINKILVEFWTRNNIELLCVQLTDPDSFSNTSFKISTTVIDIFGSMENYINFVKMHKDASLPEIKEFITLFDVQKIINFKYALEYDFVHSTLMQKKIETWEKLPGREDYLKKKRQEQVIVKITDIEYGYKFRDIDNYKDKYQLSSTIYNDNFYLIINVRFANIDQVLNDFIEDIMTFYYADPEWKIEQDVITEGMKISLKGSDYIEFVSIKPKPDSDVKYLKNK